MTTKNSWADLTDEERNLIATAYASGISPQELVDSNGLSMKPKSLARAVQRRLASTNAWSSISRGNFNKAYAAMCELIGKDPAVYNNGPKRGKSKTRKIVVLCDLHGTPDEAVMQRAVAESADKYVWGGDIFDNFAFSRFSDGKPIPVAEEIASVRAAMEIVRAETGATQDLIEGNHDQRAFNYFTSRVESQFLPLINWNLLEIVSMGIEGARVVNDKYDFTTVTGRIAGTVENAYVDILGDAYVTHAEVARKGEGRSAPEVLAFVDQWRKALNWPDPSLIIQGHVHRANIAYYAGGHTILIEGGFCGDTSSLAYAHKMGRTGYSAAVPGYTVFEQELTSDDWKTKHESVRFVLC